MFTETRTPLLESAVGTRSKEASSPTAGRQTMHRVLVLDGFVPPRTSHHVYHMHNPI